MLLLRGGKMGIREGRGEGEMGMACWRSFIFGPITLWIRSGASGLVRRDLT